MECAAATGVQMAFIGARQSYGIALWPQQRCYTDQIRADSCGIVCNLHSTLMVASTRGNRILTHTYQAQHRHTSERHLDLHRIRIRQVWSLHRHRVTPGPLPALQVTRHRLGHLLLNVLLLLPVTMIAFNATEDTSTLSDASANRLHAK